MDGDTTLDAGDHEVAQPDVGEGATHHHFVVAAPRPVRIKVLRLNTLLDEVARSRAALRDVAGGRDVIGSHRIAEYGEHTRAAHVGERLELHGHAVEVGRILDVGGLLVPGVTLPCGHADVGPVLIALEDTRVALA